MRETDKPIFSGNDANKKVLEDEKDETSSDYFLNVI